MWCPTDKTKHSSDSPRYIGSKFGFLFTCDHSFLAVYTSMETKHLKNRH